jgi:hypothetical protein
MPSCTPMCVWVEILTRTPLMQIMAWWIQLTDGEPLLWMPGRISQAER